MISWIDGVQRGSASGVRHGGGGGIGHRRRPGAQRHPARRVEPAAQPAAARRPPALPSGRTRDRADRGGRGAAPARTGRVARADARASRGGGAVGGRASHDDRDLGGGDPARHAVDRGGRARAAGARRARGALRCDDGGSDRARRRRGPGRGGGPARPSVRRPHATSDPRRRHRAHPLTRPRAAGAARHRRGTDRALAGTGIGRARDRRARPRGGGRLAVDVPGRRKLAGRACGGRGRRGRRLPPALLRRPVRCRGPRAAPPACRPRISTRGSSSSPRPSTTCPPRHAGSPTGSGGSVRSGPTWRAARRPVHDGDARSNRASPPGRPQGSSGKNRAFT